MLSVAGSRRVAFMVGALVFASFFAYSAIRFPVPSVNEPHYLTKARHVWDASWCAGDFFLESSNPHLVFYRTIGGLTSILPFEEAAWCGRVLCQGILAGGWCVLMWAILPARWSPLWSAWVFMAMAVTGNFSGEWLLGGAESKVPAYGFGFMALAALIRSKPISAGITGGLCVSFHPVVGLWLGLCAICGLAWQQLGRVLRRNRSAADSIARTSMVKHWLMGAVMCVALAAPGMIPAVEIIRDSEATADDVISADHIQVFHRLGHHLNPMRFKRTAYLGYALLFVTWLVIRRWSFANDKDDGTKASDAGRSAESIWTACVVTSVLVALAGVWIGYREAEEPPTDLDVIRAEALKTKYLKLYPFRVADVLLPMAASISLVGIAWRAALTTGRPAQAARQLSLATLALFAYALLTHGVDRNPSRMKPERLANWLEVCRWIHDDSPPDALVYIPSGSFAFKWHAHRPEVFSMKDCPQDTAGILEWYSRWHALTTWEIEAEADEIFTQTELDQLASDYGVRLLITRRGKSFEPQPLFKNSSYAVFACVASPTQ
ncbi:MAG: hypothetical protein O3A00_11165 [Planctomycetota bacterium]|nr:hypothetical protein [Planctomycetota bacterium]